MSNDRSKFFMPLTIGFGATAAAAYTAYSYLHYSDSTKDVTIDLKPQSETNDKEDVSNNECKEDSSRSLSPISIPSLASSANSSPSKSAIQSNDEINNADASNKSSYGLSWLFK